MQPYQLQFQHQYICKEIAKLFLKYQWLEDENNDWFSFKVDKTTTNNCHNTHVTFESLTVAIELSCEFLNVLLKIEQ